MLDRPDADALLSCVSDTLKGLIDALPPRQQFELRVAISALSMVRREHAQRPALDAAEHGRLVALLGHDGDLAALNDELCDRLSDGSLDLTTPGLADHLWRTTLDKVSIDQPKHPTYAQISRTLSLKD